MCTTNRGNPRSYGHETEAGVRAESHTHTHTGTQALSRNLVWLLFVPLEKAFSPIDEGQQSL